MLVRQAEPPLGACVRHLVFTLASLLCVAAATVELRGQDTTRTYFEFQVTKPVRQDTGGTKAPRYPPELRAAGVEGEVLIQFVVDTMGNAVVGSIRVLRSSHEMFSTAVITAIPTMRFVPAEVNGRKVKQLVQQPFVFAISRTDASVPPAPRAPSASDVVPPSLGSAQITPAPHTGTVDGWMLAQRTTVDSANGRAPFMMEIRTYGAPGRYRMEVSSSATEATGGMVTLLDSVANRMSLIVSRVKGVTVTTIGAGGPAPLRTEAFAGPRVTKDLGPAERIAGVGTRRYHREGTSGTRITLGNRTCVIERPLNSDVWLTTDPVMVEVGQHTRDMLKLLSAASQLTTLLGITGETELPGVAMRRQSTNTVVKDGTKTAVATTFEITAYKKWPLDVSLFEPPEGYRLFDASASIPSPRADSIRLASAERMFARMTDSTSVLGGATRTCTTSKAP